MIRTEKLNKRFGRLHVLKDLDLEIGTGEVTAILGPNGAGKTTLIKCILGLVHPDSGRILVRGKLLDGGSEYRSRIGYMPQVPRYPENLRVREVFEMIKDLRGRTDDSGGLDAGLDEELMETLDLAGQMDKPFKTLSGGNRQRAGAALAFLFEPELIFLDEPTAGLDPLASSTLKDKILREKRAGKTFVLTSHVMSEVQELADRIVYLLDGRIHFDDSVSNLMEKTGESTLERAMARMMIRVA